MGMNVAPQDYHRRALEATLSGNGVEGRVPAVPKGARRVLDVGCGAGQTLLAMRLGAIEGVGIDIDEDALILGKQLLDAEKGPAIRFVKAAGEALPFPNDSFDFVVSRVALPYMHIATALRETRRVLRPGGRVWFTLHPTSMFPLSAMFPWHPLYSWKNTFYQTYVAFNSILFHTTGAQFRFPLNRKRIESYQTESGMKRCFEKLGFGEVAFERDGPLFIVTARKL